MRCSMPILLKSVLVAAVLLLADGTTSAPSESVAAGSLLPIRPDLRSNDVQDSHLERVHVKQETGFDGKVRSIRFSLEPETHKMPEKKVMQESQAASSPSKQPSNPDGIRSTSDTGLQSVKNPRMVQSNEMPTKLRLANGHSKDASAALAIPARTKRAIEKSSSDNELDDLQAEESKVFRPLFVYRQQVARRMRLRNDRRPDDSRRRSQRTKPNTYGHYYPYHYQPPYPYQIYHNYQPYN